MDPEPHRDASLLSPAPNPSHHQPLRPAKSVAFKREERRKRKERKRQERLALELERWEPLGASPRPAASPSVLPDTPWPCDPITHPEPSATWSWGPPSEPPREPPRPALPAASPQAAAVAACRAFFGEHVDHDEDDEEEEENNVVLFFQELLEKDPGLRVFYEAEREKGRFLCLVCEGIGARAGKRFAGCAALVQHAGSVSRTGRRLAHRAFGDAVNRLLCWSAGRSTHLPVDSDNVGMCIDHADADHSEE